MEKKTLLFIPLFAGIILMAISWLTSYPLSINSVDDFVFNHVSILYWLSLPLLLASMFMIAATFRNNYLRWIMTVGIVMTIYSTSYFYYNLPTSDAHFFRGLNENFLSTKSLDSSLPGKFYFQWPGFFILSDITTAVSGLQLASFSFIAYAILGFVLTTALYVLASENFRGSGYIAVIAFFILMFYYLNYQFAAFTVSFSLFLILLTLDNRRWTSGRIIASLLLFVGMTITHEYVAVFYILFLVARSIILKSKQYLAFVVVISTIYFAYEITFAGAAVSRSLLQLFGLSSEISALTSVVPVSVPLDVVAQWFVWATLATTAVISIIGFVFLLRKRKLLDLRKTIAILLAGVSYTAVGVVIYILGSRAIPIAFIPISLGAAYLFESRFKRYIKSVILVLLILFVFIPIHGVYYRANVFFQTEDSYRAENFLVDYHNWAKHSSVLADRWVIDYILGRVNTNAIFSTILNPNEDVDTVLYTIGLGLSMGSNYTAEKTIIYEKFNLVYDNGFSFVASK